MTQIISNIITFIMAIIFGVLACRSPKRNWEFITNWPSFALFFVGLLVGSMEPRPVYGYILPKTEFRCEREFTKELKFEVNCGNVIVEPARYVKPPSFFSVIFNEIKDIFVSALLDFPTECLGVLIGIKFTGRPCDKRRQSAFPWEQENS